MKLVRQFVVEYIAAKAFSGRFGWVVFSEGLLLSRFAIWLFLPPFILLEMHRSEGTLDCIINTIRKK